MNFVFFAAVAYDSPLGGRTRQLADILSCRHQVHFIEMPSLRRPMLRHAVRRENGVWIHHLPPLPGGWRMAGTSGEKLWITYAAAMLRQTLPPDFFAVVSNPFWEALTERLESACLIYDCLDHCSIHTKSCYAPAVAEREQHLAARSELILAVSRKLTEFWQARYPQKTFFLPNGCPDSWLEMERRQPLRPLAGFLGALYEWIDYSLLEQVVEALPEVPFEFTGPVRDRKSIAALRQMTNVEFRTAVPFCRAAEVMSRYSVGLIPFRDDPVAEYSNPLKMYEYLALGIPVVSTLPGEASLPVHVAVGAADFIRQVQRQLESPPPAEEMKRAVVSRTWNCIATDLERILKKI